MTNTTNKATVYRVEAPFFDDDGVQVEVTRYAGLRMGRTVGVALWTPGESRDCAVQRAARQAARTLRARVIR